ncbi:MAG TPA: DUF6788 family protein [Chloroflexia bacterium]|nr:DUF6788 family protein [Chloroflexia bacterium]
MVKKLAIPRRMLRALSREQLIDLGSFIRELLHTSGAGAGPGKREDSTEGRRDNKTYRLVPTRCGKPNCKCVGGPAHGPYWYAYWSEGGRTKAQYVGKRLPAGLKLKSPKRRPDGK